MRDPGRQFLAPIPFAGNQLRIKGRNRIDLRLVFRVQVGVLVLVFTVGDAQRGNARFGEERRQLMEVLLHAVARLALFTKADVSQPIIVALQAVAQLLPSQAAMPGRLRGAGDVERFGVAADVGAAERRVFGVNLLMRVVALRAVGFVGFQRRVEVVEALEVVGVAVVLLAVRFVGLRDALQGAARGGFVSADMPFEKSRDGDGAYQGDNDNNGDELGLGEAPIADAAFLHSVSLVSRGGGKFCPEGSI